MGTEYYAYQIALKTLKERCDYLQNKLASLEEENCQLKLHISEDEARKSPKSGSDLEQLRLQISILTEQKMKLNQQVHLVTSENQKMWSRLSRFSSVSDNFAKKLSEKEDPLKCSDGNLSYSENHSDLEISKVAISPEASRQSLEEISLKLNALIMEKRGVPFEFCNDVDMYGYNKSTFKMENFAFSLPDGNTPIMSNVKNHIMKLKQFKQILQNNKNDLTSAISQLKNLQRNNLCSECGKKFAVNYSGSSSVINENSVESPGNNLPTLPVLPKIVGLDDGEDAKVIDKTCPLCGTKFSGSFQEFHQHVSDHFSDEENEVTTAFELLP